jgi:RPA family protein
MWGVGCYTLPPYTRSPCIKLEAIVRIIVDTVTMEKTEEKDSPAVAYLKIVNDAGDMVETFSTAYDPKDESSFEKVCADRLAAITAAHDSKLSIRTRIESIISKIGGQKI